MLLKKYSRTILIVVSTVLLLGFISNIPSYTKSKKILNSLFNYSSYKELEHNIIDLERVLDCEEIFQDLSPSNEFNQIFLYSTFGESCSVDIKEIYRKDTFLYTTLSFFITLDNTPEKEYLFKISVNRFNSKVGGVTFGSILPLSKSSRN